MRVARKLSLTVVLLCGSTGLIGFQLAAPEAAGKDVDQAAGEKCSTSSLAELLRRTQIDLAVLAYEQFKLAKQGGADVSDDDLHRLSRELLMLKLELAQSRSDCIATVKEYLEREGVRVVVPKP